MQNMTTDLEDIIKRRTRVALKAEPKNGIQHDITLLGQGAGSLGETS